MMKISYANLAKVAFFISVLSLFVNIFNFYESKRKKTSTLCRYVILKTGLQVVRCENEYEICFIEKKDLNCKIK